MRNDSYFAAQRRAVIGNVISALAPIVFIVFVIMSAVVAS